MLEKESVVSDWSAWIGLLELFLWVIFCFYATEKWYPSLNNWALAQIDEEEERRKLREQ